MSTFAGLGPRAVRAVLGRAMIDLAWRGDPCELKAWGFMAVEYAFDHIIKEVRAG
jgi:hypothetical protein